MRSNPLDNTREPKGVAALAVGAAAALVLGVGAYFLHADNENARLRNVQAAVLAAGYGEAVVEPIKGDECWRAREGYAWRTATASGSACAGPRNDVELFPGIDRPRLSDVADKDAKSRS